MEKCQNFAPLNRPTADELKSQLEEYLYSDEIRKQKKNFILIIYLDSRLQFFSIPDNIIDEENETQEM
ncbi:hypothetical protein Glove_139g28 [Diversispora epigaea]|uniref:Uncharacterized protein n=1 Tax=Diversispora epigaea TaxID=1348612 RepID=A0A397J521_9GLOM|nr:hypothetical protein Glove_139g28 [Diversispora epigaea]